MSKGEEDLEQALSLASNILVLWAQGDEEWKREILDTVFTRFVVDRQRIVDVEVIAPYRWVLRLKSEKEECISPMPEI